MLAPDLFRCTAIAVALPLTLWAQEVPKEDEQVAGETGEVAAISCPDLIQKAKDQTLTVTEWKLLDACFLQTPPLLPPGIGQGTVAVIPDLPGRGDPYGLSTFGSAINGMVDG